MVSFPIRTTIALLSSLLIVAPPRVVRSDCPPVIVRLPELFQSQSIVLRLQKKVLDSSTSNSNSTAEQPHYQAPCSFAVEDGSYENRIPEYEIVQVFKGNLTAGDSIAVLYGTDTGFRLTLPSWLTESPSGFLAFLSPVTDCYDGDDDDNATMVEDREDLNVYSMSECLDHEPWDNLSDEDKAILDSNDSNTPTTSPKEGSSSGSSTILVAASKKAALLLTTVLW